MHTNYRTHQDMQEGAGAEERGGQERGGGGRWDDPGSSGRGWSMQMCVEKEHEDRTMRTGWEQMVQRSGGARRGRGGRGGGAYHKISQDVSWPPFAVVDSLCRSRLSMQAICPCGCVTNSSSLSGIADELFTQLHWYCQGARGGGGGRVQPPLQASSGSFL